MSEMDEILDPLELSSEQLELEEALLEAVDDKQKDDVEKKSFPKEVYVFALVRRPFFPGMVAPLFIEPGPFYEVLKEISQTQDKCVGLFLTKKEDVDLQKLNIDDLYSVGVLGRILRIMPAEKGGAQVIFSMEKRIKIAKKPKTNFPIKVEIKYQEDTPFTDETKAHAISIISTIKELLKLNPLYKEELQIFLGHSDFTEAGKLADFAVAFTTSTREELQEILETFDLPVRLQKALVLLKKETELTQLHQNITKKIESNLSKGQKDYYLREQLKTIKKELGIEKDDKQLERSKFEARLKDRNVPKEVLTVINEELEKFSALEPHSSEYGVTRGYIDWLTILPWGVNSVESHNLEEAKKILEEDHYGLEDIKERILELIAISKLSGSIKGNIICLVGPPGVGKTSVGKSIARALNRKFYRFSVGGMRDEAEIKGHRRTYVGAMPGKLIQALKICQTMNPVIMLDEIDKIGNSYHGDPASALLEVLDPEQNKEFLDHYLDVRCDLSNILFIVTANVLDTIPEPLKDRMEILRLSGYIMEEKVQISKKYLIPRNRMEMGLMTSNINFTDKAIRSIINGYAREAGVRGLENQFKKIMRKIAFNISSEMEKNPNNTKKSKTNWLHPEDLQTYLGKPIFTSERLFKKTPVGVATGLAWTAMGGATLYIETMTVKHEKQAELKLTGQIGKVMLESADIAWSFLHSALPRYAPTIPFFEKTQVHLHIPEGATPKDGPSGGITLVTALLSLLTGNEVPDKLGMTGEITLTGRVLPVGGIREKVVAARRAGLNILIMPEENRRDYEELSEYLKKDLTVHFVNEYDQIVPIAFPKLNFGKKTQKKKNKSENLVRKKSK